MNKPTVFNGKDCSKFRTWWLNTEAYLTLSRRYYNTDKAKINWVGSFLYSTVQDWHYIYIRSLKEIKHSNTWRQYVEALTKRFTDPVQVYQDLEKIKALKYYRNIL